MRQWNLWKAAPSARWPSLLPCLYLHCPACPGFQPVIAHDYDSLWGTLWCHLPLPPLCLPLFVPQFLTFLSHFCCLLLIFGFLFNLFSFFFLDSWSYVFLLPCSIPWGAVETNVLRLAHQSKGSLRLDVSRFPPLDGWLFNKLCVHVCVSQSQLPSFPLRPHTARCFGVFYILDP